MKKLIFAVLAIAALAFSDNQSEYCAGFSFGYRTVKGNNAIVPICPIAPITPIGSTPYQEGVKAGMRRAQSN